MKAAVVRQFGGGFHTEEVSVSHPEGREVLVQVRASGLCHSDELAASTNLGYDVPAVFGHEVSGVVEAIGPDVTEFQVGDHVVGCLVQFCGACDRCLTGRVHLCRRPESTVRSERGEARLTDTEGQALSQGMALGGFAEFALIHENQLARVPDTVPFPQAALLGCGVVTGAGAVMNTANVQAGETVAIVGAGGVGLNAVSGAVVAGASRIIVIDIADDKLDTAKSFGATVGINSRSVDPVAAVLEATDGNGADHVFDFVGAGDTTAQALQMVGKGGGLYLIGVLDPTTSVNVSNIDMLMRQSRIQGVYMGSTNPKRDIPMIAELYLQGRYELDALVSKEISIDEVNEGYAALKDPTVNRVVITSF
ncbi:zinc-binding dehydrogenase [Leucobacter musarum]|uniref:zinc-binding dehydrogenase n=1 Tax=Leucobacter musarum TaxID=1930747 RepID=UPI0006A77833|nr:Zn-dependent alcohol dehydrogenase [Leucobacter musarum]